MPATPNQKENTQKIQTRPQRPIASSAVAKKRSTSSHNSQLYTNCQFPPSTGFPLSQCLATLKTNKGEDHRQCGSQGK